MRITATIALCLLAFSAWGQSSTQVRILDTMADLMARKPVANETVQVRNKSSTILWSAPRSFTAYSTSTITNAHDGTHYVTNGVPGSIYASNDRNDTMQCVEWFGATGDGTTDDAGAIQSALDFTPTAGQVYLRKGNYALASQLTVSTRLLILGAGPLATKLIRTGTNSNPVIRFDSGGFANGWKLNDLSIDGGGVAPGVFLDQFGDGEMEGCHVYNYIEYGVNIYQTVHSAIRENRFRTSVDTNSAAILVSGAASGHTIAGNSFATAATGIRLDEPSNGLWIGPANTFEGNLVGIRIPKRLAGSAQALTIAGNFFESNSEYHIWVGDGEAAADIQGLSIMGNEFASSTTQQILFNDAAFISVFGNRFGSPVTYGANLSRLSLRGNRYSNGKTNLVATAGGYFDEDDLPVKNVDSDTYTLNGQLGVGDSDPQSKVDIAGSLRVTSNAPIPTNGTGVELSFQTSPELGLLNVLNRSNGIYKPLSIRSSSIQGLGAQYLEWSTNSTASWLSDTNANAPATGYGRLWWKDLGSGLRGLIVRHPNGTDTQLGSGGAFSFSDLTNALLMGSNMSAVYTSSNMTISASGGGATNGTAVSVDGGVALSVANLADGGRIGFTASGTNVSADVVDGSLSTNKIDATFHGLLVAGGGGGTSVFVEGSSVSDPNFAESSEIQWDVSAVTNVTPSIKSASIATNKIDATFYALLTDPATVVSTNITDSTSAGRALLTAADAAAQRTTLAVTNYQGGVGVQLTSTNFSHNIEAGTNITLTTNGTALVINAAGGSGGGTTNIVSSSAAGLAPQATADSYLGSTAAGAVQWFTRQIATNVFWGTPGTNTWTVPTNFLCGYVVAIGGGGGGQAGARRASTVATAGGSGGMPAGVNERWITAADFGTNTTVEVVVGAGGAGGAAATADDTVNGATGSSGGDSRFGTYLTGLGGAGGIVRGAGSFGAGPASSRAVGTVSGSVSTTGQNDATVIGYVGAGQTGTGITAANAAAAFSTVWNGYGTGSPGIDPTGQLAGGANGGSAGASGGDGTSTALSGPYPGGGGGGGRSHASAAAGNGGNGGNYGASGGGGGASRNGFASGAGGNGGSGCVWIMYITR